MPSAGAEAMSWAELQAAVHSASPENALGRREYAEAAAGKADSAANALVRSFGAPPDEIEVTLYRDKVLPAAAAAILPPKPCRTSPHHTHSTPGARTAKRCGCGSRSGACHIACAR